MPRIHHPVLLVVLAVQLGCTTSVDSGEDGDICDDGACDASTALCEVSVSGHGKVPVETRYIPNVIACENPNGGIESLKAQAIAVRSYATYVVRSERRALKDGQGDQVFSCGRPPSAVHFQAAEETAGQVLQYKGTRVASFFVAGSLQSGPSCRGGTNDPTKTERFVTYNEGLSGSSVTQTSLGSRKGGNNANRGCMSQNGANCLAQEGRTADDILRFYYGTDIELVQMTGSCVGAPVDPNSKWIGDVCLADETCDFQVGANTASCLTFPDPDSGGTAGFCTATCNGSCPDLSGRAGTRCVRLEGAGQCAPVPATQNQNCGAIPGTLPTVMFKFGTSTPTTVCAPLAAEFITCTGGGQSGECIDTNVSSCSGTLHSNACPGGNNIRCCTL